MFKKIMYSAFIFCLSTSSTQHLNAKTLHDYHVFEKWMKIQRVYEDPNLNVMAQQLDNDFLARFKNTFEKDFKHLKDMRPFLKTITGESITEEGYHLAPPVNDVMKKTFTKIYASLQENPLEFVNLLKNNAFSNDQINDQEQKTHYDVTVEKYKAFMRLLFPTLLDLQQDEFLFNVGNRLFEYCFDESSFHHYQSLLTTNNEYPLVRCINSSLWYLLVGEGWKHWHKNCLTTLKQAVTKGQPITYVAGGNDFYQLLKSGMYNINIIDPFLPTQDRYYAENWQWLINGEYGDEILCNFDAKKITLKRKDIVHQGTFSAKLSSGNIIDIPKTIIIWDVYDNSYNTPIGKVVIERRFATQQDFALDKVTLCSYDELVYAVAPEMLNGWGINPGLIDDTKQIHVKQLRKPANKENLLNVRTACLLNFTDVRFINYASDPH